MTIRVECECGQSYNVGDDKAGRRFRCQACQGIVQVPEMELEVAEEADPFDDDFGDGDEGQGQEEQTYDENPYAAPRKSSRKRGKKRQDIPNLPLGLGWWLFAWQRSFNFEDRARRREFWFFNLYNFIISMLISIGLNVMISVSGEEPAVVVIALIINLIISVVPIIPGLAAAVRRLHDIGKSGWWYLLILACGIGGLILLVFFFMDSEEETNQWGPCPK